MKNITTTETLIRQYTEIRQKVLHRVQIDRAVELRRHNDEMERIRKIESEVQFSASPHDCSEGGTRRVYKVRNVMDAILTVLPEKEGEAMQQREIVRALHKAGYTYAYATVAIALSRYYQFEHYIDASGVQWNLAKFCRGFMSYFKTRA